MCFVKLFNIKIKQIYCCLFLMFVMLLFMSGCSADEPTLVTTFSVSVREVTDFSAEILITHDGTNRDNYYAFVVKGENIDVMNEINRHHESLKSSSDTFYDQKKRIVKFGGLSPESVYTCIIYGVDEFGTPTGASASAVFKTSDIKIIFEENPNWSVYYEGQGTYNGLTYSKATVYVKGDVEERYFICIYDKSTIDKYPTTKEFIMYAYSNFANEHNEFEDEYFWLEDDFVRTESTTYYKYLHKGVYQAFAIGVDYVGNLTGHYAFSNVFEFEKYELQQEYSEILGDWILTDETGATITLTFNEGWANNYFTVTGWGYNDAPFKVYYYGKGLYFYGLYPLTISRQTVVGRKWDDGQERELTLTGWYIRDDGTLRFYDTGTALARADRNDDGSYTFNATFKKTSGNDGEEAATGILVSYQDDNGKTFYLNSSVIQFPFTMKKIN